MPTRYIQRGQPPVYLGTGTSPAPPGVASVGVDDTVGSIFEWKGGDGVRHQILGNGVLGAVTQGTSKATGVTLNAAMGDITLNNAALGAATIVSFTLTNSYIGASDVLVFNHVSGGTVGSYTFTAAAAAGTAVIYVRNATAGSLSEAAVVRFAVIKGATAS